MGKSLVSHCTCTSVILAQVMKLKLCGVGDPLLPLPESSLDLTCLTDMQPHVRHVGGIFQLPLSKMGTLPWRGQPRQAGNIEVAPQSSRTTKGVLDKAATIASSAVN
jgi:hypothetical protein